MRRGLQDVLAETDDFQVVSTAGSPAVGMRSFDELQPDLVVMDLHWPSADTLRVLSHFKETRPEARVLILLGSNDVAPALAALARGADGLLHSTVEPAVLLGALRLLRQGESFVVHHPVWQRVAHVYEAGTPAGQRHLSAREREVLALIAADQTDREIAATLTISGATAKHHVVHVLHKLNVASREEAARMAHADPALGAGMVVGGPARAWRQDGAAWDVAAGALLAQAAPSNAAADRPPTAH